MARARRALPAQIDVAQPISAGVLISVCPPTLIEEVLADAGKASQRERRLRAPAVVYCVMTLEQVLLPLPPPDAPGRGIGA